jgi:diguanylate cyclase (GGDEF)-like protein
VARIRAEDGGTLEFQLMRKNGTRLMAEITAYPARSPDGSRLGFVNTFRDISERKRYEAELERLASEDPLTGLANQRVFQRQLASETARAMRHGRPLSVAVLDLDHFKDVNDRYGHIVGDRVLREVARRLGGLVRESELLARVGGEEFAWILPDADGAGAFAAAERARFALAAEPLAPVGRLTLSAGVCDLAATAEASELFGCADEALYQAKRTGRDRTVRYA